MNQLNDALTAKFGQPPYLAERAAIMQFADQPSQATSAPPDLTTSAPPTKTHRATGDLVVPIEKQVDQILKGHDLPPR